MQTPDHLSGLWPRALPPILPNTDKFARMKVAIIHDWMVPMSGAERVLEQMLLVYPGADVFTAMDFLPAEHRHRLRGARVHTSFMQNLPGAAKHVWKYVPLMPIAMEQFDLAPYDLVLSNSHAVAKGVIVHPHQAHVCYLLTPMRFAWDQQSLYLEAHGFQRGLRGLAARLAFAYLRQWDAASSARVDAFISISHYVARRAEQCYGRGSTVLAPPVDTEFFTPGERRDDFYLAASRLTPFKNIGAIVEAFRELPDRKLVVIGDGPEAARIRRMATRNVTLLGYQSDEVLRDHLRRARALVFAAPEDFGLIMAEANACGTPVVALRPGGAVDIVREDPHARTGLLFETADPAGIAAAISAFERLPAIDRETCRANAERFSPAHFRGRLAAEVSAVLDAMSAGQRAIGGPDAFRHRIGHAVEAEAPVTAGQVQALDPAKKLADRG
jgi:glycosyltransferase involved in cell wall biosynthesis